MIPVYKPWLTSLEKKYVNEAMESSWISSTGKFVDQAEEKFAEFIGTKHCIVTTSGTSALHLAVKALDVSGHTVIVPNCTFAATGFAPAYENCHINLVDINPITWNISPREVFKNRANTRAIIPVHLYGNPANMKELKLLQEAYDFKIIEDACESIGATIDGKMTGSIGDVGCFSFYGNKTFTCGEGGALVTDDDEVAEKARLLRGQAQDSKKRYWHVDVGHNYRMTNVQAAILCAQIERADEILSEKKRVADRYHQRLKDWFIFQGVEKGSVHSNWLVTAMLLDGGEFEPFAQHMRSNGVDVRRTFYPMNQMPPFQKQNLDGRVNGRSYPHSEELSKSGVSFPSYPELTNKEIDYICDIAIDYVS